MKGFAHLCVKPYFFAELLRFDEKQIFKKCLTKHFIGYMVSCISD